MRALAKILADVFCSMMLDHGWDEKWFAEVTGFMGMNLSLIPAADIVGSAAIYALRPLAFAWSFRRAESDDPRLYSLYDRNLFEESLDCVACDKSLRSSFDGTGQREENSYQFLVGYERYAVVGLCAAHLH